jgi:hypothetical protein
MRKGQYLGVPWCGTQAGEEFGEYMGETVDGELSGDDVDGP